MPSSKYQIRISEIGIPTFLSDEFETYSETNAEDRAYNVAERFNCAVDLFRDGEYAATIAVAKHKAIRLLKKG